MLPRKLFDKRGDTLDGAEIRGHKFRSGNRKIELGFDSQHQIHHVHRGQPEFFEVSIRPDLPIWRAYLDKIAHNGVDARGNITGWNIQHGASLFLIARRRSFGQSRRAIGRDKFIQCIEVNIICTDRATLLN